MPEPYKYQWAMVEKALGVPHFFCGDDMGIGKTVEAILLDRERRDLTANAKSMGGPGIRPGELLTLIVAPMSVASVWQSHFKEWNPALRVVTVYGEDDSPQMKKKDRDLFVDRAKKGLADVFICHWESLRLMPGLRQVRWFHIIADEAHRAKNRKAQQTMALKKLSTSHKLALTGTPADNRPDDIWSILNWLYPSTWSSYWNFFKTYVVFKQHNVGACLACDGFHKNAYREIVGIAAANDFHKRIDPYYTRRRKDDPEVGLELPEKYYTKIEVNLHPQQRRAYEEMRKSMLAWVGKHEDEPIAAPIVIAQLVRLQQFAGAYAGLEVAMVWDRQTGELVPRKVVRLQEPSSKLDALMELIRDHEEKKFVVFSQSRQLMELLATRLASSNIDHVLFTGNTPQKVRGSFIEKFQHGSARVFAGTVSAGGVGITLTAASTLVFTDRHPSPAVGRQAEDRLHRIGQRNNVQVIDLIAHNTIDWRRLDQIEMKWSVIKQLLGES